MVRVELRDRRSAGREGSVKTSKGEHLLARRGARCAQMDGCVRKGTEGAGRVARPPGLWLDVYDRAMAGIAVREKSSLRCNLPRTRGDS
jgi:hypothetical protein